MRLLAVDAPATVKAGEPLRLTWTFECRGAVESGWKVFVHVVGPSGTMLANGDHAPARPFEWWQPGQVIRYSTTVALPRGAHGRYMVMAGLFKGPARAQARAPRARVDRDAVEIAGFEVAP